MIYEHKRVIGRLRAIWNYAPHNKFYLNLNKPHIGFILFSNYDLIALALQFGRTIHFYIAVRHVSRFQGFKVGRS